MAKIHLLKTDTAVWQPVFDNHKRFEIRKDDRGIAPGDILVLRETRATGVEMAAGAPLEYTGRVCSRFVCHALRAVGEPAYGLAAGWAIFSVRPLDKAEKSDWKDDIAEALK